MTETIVPFTQLTDEVTSGKAAWWRGTACCVIWAATVWIKETASSAGETTDGPLRQEQGSEKSGEQCLNTGTKNLTGTWNFTTSPAVRYFWGNGNIFTKEGKLRGRLINHKVDSKNCLQCHQESAARKSGTLYAAPYDVHIKAGFQCTDCHGLAGNTKNQRLRHEISKGWSPAGLVKNKLDGIGMKTCAGCHIEGHYRQVRADMPREAKNPTKIHKEKFPRASSHFNILHCAACHSTGQPGKGIYLMDASTGNTRFYTADSLEAATAVDTLSGPASKPWKPWITRFEKTRGDGGKYIPCVTTSSQWFGEKQANGEVKPISLRYVRQAFKGLRGLTTVEVKNVKGEKVSESTVATHGDIVLMIKALSNMGFTNVVFVADRIYEDRQGKVVTVETSPVVRGPTFPASSDVSQWFGERQETGEISPIKLQYVLQAYRSIEGISMIEHGKRKGTKRMEPAVATNADIRLMIKTLSDMGYKHVVYVTNRLYEIKRGTLKSSILPATLSGASPTRKTSPWFGEKLADGDIRPIRSSSVEQAMKNLKGLTLAEIRNAKGEKVMEPIIVTNTDIERMIKALTDQGLKNVVFMASRLYEVRHGKLVSSPRAQAVSRPSFPVFHNVLPVEKKKTYGAKGSPDGCLDCHGENAAFFTNMKILNPGRFLKEDYPTPKEPNAEPQMYEWGMRSVPSYE
ncbi:MAG: multiheme c-type cytochrome [Deltaproteobacteria bacterium]|nr:multiheme c-type cytochrome [Deltaproteobacteria bacterium]